jgi:hypothetical protein
LDVQENYLDVQENYLDVQENYLDVQEDYLDVQENYLDVQEDYLDVQENYLDVQENYLDVQEDYLDVQEDYLDVQENYLDIQENYLDIQENYLDVPGGDSAGIPCAGTGETGERGGETGETAARRFKKDEPAPGKPVTFGGGEENGGRGGLAENTGVAGCFCCPHSPREKGTGENTGGLDRSGGGIAPAVRFVRAVARLPRRGSPAPAQSCGQQIRSMSISAAVQGVVMAQFSSTSGCSSPKTPAYCPR